MPATVDLVERSGDLKRDLLAFARGPRFARALQRALAERFGRVVVGDEGELFNFLDHFILQRRQADGRTVVEHFVEEHPELPEAERAMLLGWREVVEGIFAVQGRDGLALIVENLIDELPYRVRSNMGPSVFTQFPVGSYMIGRLVPVGDEWLISGATSVLAPSRRADANGAAANIATQMPSLVFRNPAKVEQGWELQREERRQFIDFFGADLVVLPGHELAERMRDYARYRHYDARRPGSIGRRARRGDVRRRPSGGRLRVAGGVPQGGDGRRHLRRGRRDELLPGLRPRRGGVRQPGTRP